MSVWVQRMMIFLVKRKGFEKDFKYSLIVKNYAQDARGGEAIFPKKSEGLTQSETLKNHTYTNKTIILTRPEKTGTVFNHSKAAGLSIVCAL